MLCLECMKHEGFLIIELSHLCIHEYLSHESGQSCIHVKVTERRDDK